MAVAEAVAIEVSLRVVLEATKQLTEDRTTDAQDTAATARAERDSLETRLAQAEAKIEELRAAAVTANDVAEKATTTTATVEAAARDVAQTATQGKMTLELKVAELEQDWVTARLDLWTVNRQFSELTNRLQVVSD